jgi:hypothetical protein
MNQTNADISTLGSEQSEATDRVLLLQNDPELAARQTEREVDEATGKKSETQQEVQRLDSRRNELTILGF